MNNTFSMLTRAGSFGRALALPITLVLVAFSSSAQDMMSYEELLAHIGQTAMVPRTWSSDVEMTVSIGGQNMKYEGIIFAKGDQLYSVLKMNMMGQIISLITIVDSNNIQWTETTVAGIKRVVKVDLNKAGDIMESQPGMGGLGIMSAGASLNMAQDPRDVLEGYSAMYTMRSEKVEMMDGVEVYVIHGRIKAEFKELMNPKGVAAKFGASMNDIHVVVSKDDGFVRQIEMLGANRKPFSTTRYRNVKLNEPVDETLFRYTPAKGVQVQDMTAQILQSAEVGSKTN